MQSKRIALFLVFLVGVLLIPDLAKQLTGGFRLGKMSLDVFFNPAWEVAEPSQETDALVKQILARPLRYLSHGAQSFVFASEDGNYIVKLFRYDQKVHPWRQWFRDEVLKKKKRYLPDEKVHRLFSSCKLAYEQASDLTGLVYVHLNRTKGKLPHALFIDRLGRRYDLDMDRYRFAVQHRGRHIREVFKEAIDSQDQAKTERLIDSFFALLRKRTERKIRNSDTKISPNFGFFGEEAMEWDFGNYWVDPKMEEASFRSYEIGLFTGQLRQYLERTAPEYLPYYDRASKI